MDKKVLIFFPHAIKQRHGGPYSMLYHLQEGLKSFSNKVTFLSSQIDSISNTTIPVVKSRFTTARKLIKPFVSNRFSNGYKIKKWVREVSEPDEKVIQYLSLSQFDILHFHETIDIWRYRKFLENYTGKVILTSHTPKPYHFELLEDVMLLNKTMVSERSYQLIKSIDVFAYSKPQHLLFPCKEATESYLEYWPQFGEFMLEKNIDYVTTGVVPSSELANRNATRLSLKIPDEAFVVTFIGRKIPVKGYDLLVEAARLLLPLCPDLYFIIVGKRSHATLTHNRWIETGWTEEPFTYVEAGNLHVVPNRFTNFDLNVLEVLSLGKPILLSDTGGNKHFKQFGAAGIFYHKPTVADLFDKLKAGYEEQQHLEETGNGNKQIYQKHFTAERFAKDQVTFYNSL